MFVKPRYFIFLSLFSSLCTWAQRPIEIRAEQVINLSTQGNAWHLFDEQGHIHSPQEVTSREPATAFNAGYNKLYNPASIVIDFQENYSLEQIWFYDSNGKDTIKIFSGTPGNWHFEKQVITDSYRSWRPLALNLKTRLLRIEFRWPQAQVNELVFFGKPLGTNKKSMPPPVNRKPVPMDQLIGVNAFVDDPLDKVQEVAGTVREYHRWQWDEGNDDKTYQGFPNGKFAFNPSYAGNWNFDEYYRQLHLRGIDVSPCLQSQPLYLRATRGADAKPIPLGADAEDPSSYRAHADYLFQFAARYGNREVAKQELKLRADQAPKSGLGYLYAVENWNEPDKWWRGREGYFTPFEYAAMCSADYDGHEGSLGKSYGVKNADPMLPMVMAGLASLNTEYLKGMLLWSEFNRETGFPADVLNFHHYSNDAGGQEGRPSRAVSPEADSLKYRLMKLVEFRDKYLPGKPIWLSEFGYDTNPASVQGVRSDDAEAQQGEWLVRSFLEIAASGIDRAQVFMLRDVNSENPVKYNSSGLTREKWNKHEPKKSFYMLEAFKSLLTGFYFQREVPTGLDKVNRYEFYNPQSKEYIWAIWCYDEDIKEPRKVDVNVNGRAQVLVELTTDSNNEKIIKLDGKRHLVLRVRSRPQFVVFKK